MEHIKLAEALLQECVQPTHVLAILSSRQVYVPKHRHCSHLPFSPITDPAATLHLPPLSSTAENRVPSPILGVPIAVWKGRRSCTDRLISLIFHLMIMSPFKAFIISLSCVRKSSKFEKSTLPSQLLTNPT